MNRREQLIELVREVADKLGTQKITCADFCRETGLSANQVYVNFDGWRELCKLAGLEPNMQNVKLDDDKLFSAMRDAFVKLGGITTRTRFSRSFQYSVDVFKSRGLNWNATLVAFRQWCEHYAPDFPYINDLPKELIPDTRLASSPPSFDERTEIKWEQTTGRVYGDFLNFRGLQHSPVNEQGVVFLFGMIAHELGYVVESVQTGYPDCSAKRRVGKDRWERVSIEFEFKSRSFRDHGHDPKGCNVLVCWEHNYPGCPVEVLELREAIKSLKTT